MSRLLGSRRAADAYRAEYRGTSGFCSAEDPQSWRQRRGLHRDKTQAWLQVCYTGCQKQEPQPPGSDSVFYTECSKPRKNLAVQVVSRAIPIALVLRIGRFTIVEVSRPDSIGGVNQLEFLARSRRRLPRSVLTRQFSPQHSHRLAAEDDAIGLDRDANHPAACGCLVGDQIALA